MVETCRPPDWNSFYLAVAGAAATLLSLLSVAVQFNIDTLASDPGSRWRAVARFTLTTKVLLLILPLIVLVPKLDGTICVLALLGGVLGGSGRAVMIWLRVGRGIF